VSLSKVRSRSSTAEIGKLDESLLVFSEGDNTITIDEQSLKTIGRPSEILAAISSKQMKSRVLADLSQEKAATAKNAASLDESRAKLKVLLDQAKGEEGGATVTVPLSRVPVLSPEIRAG